MDNIDAHVIEKGGKITAPVMHQALYDVAVLDGDATATLPWREGYRKNNGGGGGRGKEEEFSSFDGGENCSGTEEGDGQSGEGGKGRRRKKKKTRRSGGSSLEDVEAMFGKRK